MKTRHQIVKGFAKEYAKATKREKAYLHLPAAKVSLWKNIGSVWVGLRKIQENIWKYCDQLDNSEVNVAKVKSNATWGKPDSSPQVNQVGGACDVYPPSS